jgi:dihydropteroate synthase
LQAKVGWAETGADVIDIGADTTDEDIAVEPVIAALEPPIAIDMLEPAPEEPDTVVLAQCTTQGEEEATGV